MGFKVEKEEGEGYKMVERSGSIKIVELEENSTGYDVEKDKKLSKLLSLDMFERVDKRLKRKYTTNMKLFYDSEKGKLVWTDNQKWTR